MLSIPSITQGSPLVRTALDSWRVRLRRRFLNPTNTALPVFAGPDGALRLCATIVLVGHVSRQGTRTREVAELSRLIVSPSACHTEFSTLLFSSFGIGSLPCYHFSH
jgi:hypothetical protein